MDELAREFLIESQEGLDRMEICLTELETRPHDAALLGDIFRSVHTIKGTTGFLGFKRLENLAHAGENLLGLLRDCKLEANRTLISALLQLLDRLRSILKLIETEASEGEGEDTELIALLEELQVPAGHLASQAMTARTSAPMQQQPAISRSAPMEESSACGVAPRLDAPAEAACAVPPETSALPSPEPLESTATPAPGTNPGSAGESTLRVDVAHLNRMMNLVGELVLTRNQVLQAAASDPKMTILSRRLDMVTADLRESVMKARMQPVSNIFSKMPRIIRDLSQSLGRRVRVQVEGQDTELDKSLLEAIKDPLTHAVRNALDHGIEPPDVREAAGKDSVGTLKLRAAYEGSHVIIEVSDDGAGIPVEKVRQKAIERGVITAERAARLCDRELLQHIFLPGFSTAAKVTNISGRGVGMDVVRTNIERIGGKVEIDSHTRQGTTLRLCIPLTLAIIPALIVRSLGQSFALPQGSLSELVHIPADQTSKAIEWIEGAPLYRLRGNFLPLVFLDRVLQPAGERRAASTRDNFIAVLEVDGRHFGLVVDGLADPEEIVVKPLSAVLRDIGLYSGATVLGNADLALILNPGAIAINARVTINSRDSASVPPEGAESDEVAKGLEYLLVEVAGHRAAIPLSEVLRIVQLPLSCIEYIGYRPVLNFEGELMPVEDPGGVITAARDNALADHYPQIIVVVCRDGNRHVGIAVSQVLDVAAGSTPLEAGTRQRADGVTLLKKRVTKVVGLGEIASLPVVDNPCEELDQIARKLS